MRPSITAECWVWTSRTRVRLARMETRSGHHIGLCVQSVKIINHMGYNIVVQVPRAGHLWHYRTLRVMVVQVPPKLYYIDPWNSIL